MRKPRDKVIVALDVSAMADAKKLVNHLSGCIQIFKVGSELFTACGPEIIAFLRKKKKKVFLDLKFHDIPNTVERAVRASAKLGVFMMNVHAAGGSRMMRQAHTALTGISKKPHLVAVTVLTSMLDEDLIEIGLKEKPDEQVLHLARLAKVSGLDGVVCSGREVSMIRKVIGSKFLLVTPGVRPLWAAKGDQKRVTTPEEAIRQGSDFVVVGRPIIEAKDPVGAARRVLSDIDAL